jgi:hypothetical protein
VSDGSCMIKQTMIVAAVALVASTSCGGQFSTSPSSLPSSTPPPPSAGFRSLGIGETVTSTITVSDPICGFMEDSTPCQVFWIAVPQDGVLTVRMDWPNPEHELSFSLNSVTPGATVVSYAGNVSPIIEAIPVVQSANVDVEVKFWGPGGNASSLPTEAAQTYQITATLVPR